MGKDIRALVLLGEPIAPSHRLAVQSIRPAAIQIAAAQPQPHEPVVALRTTPPVRPACRLLTRRRMESNDTLRFLEAKNVETPAGRLNDFVLVSPTDAKLGTLDGVVVSPLERQVRYYVVKTGGWFGRRYLLPATPARLESDRHALQVDLEPEDMDQLARTDLHQFAAFCDADVVDSMFATHRDF